MLRAGDLLVLTGELGAGKTTFTQGLGEGLGVREGIISPTFVLVRIHPNLPDGPHPGGPDLVHVDAYRLGSASEIDDIDLENTLDSSVTVVEWGRDRVEHLSDSRLEVELHRFHRKRRHAVGGTREGGRCPGLRCRGRRRAPHHHHPRLRPALGGPAGPEPGIRRDPLMLILAIDTSAVASAALVSDDALEGVVGSFSTEDTRSHAEVLAPGIEKLLAEADVTGADIDAIVVGVGRGPFTGLRSGIATARTLAFVVGQAAARADEPGCRRLGSG